MRNAALLSAVSLLALAGCRADQVTAASAGAARARVAVGHGWIVGRQGTPVQVTYQVVGGRAVFEGDIDLGPADRVAATREQLEAGLPAGARGNSVITGSMYRWYKPTGVGGLVPYVVDPSLPNPQRAYDAMSHISSRVPSITFVARTTETAYVRFVPNNAEPVCRSYVGRQGGEQAVTLNDDCTTGNTIHELGHALGFWHEQSRCDRNTYVEIHLENVDPQYAFAFDQKCSSSTTSSEAGTDYYSYDEGSIMHYDPYAFSINGLPTIVSKRGLDYLMGNRDALSYTDANTLATMYPSRRRACC